MLQNVFTLLRIIIPVLNLLNTILILGLVILIIHRYRQTHVRLLLLLASSFFFLVLANLSSFFLPASGGFLEPDLPGPTPMPTNAFQMIFLFLSLYILIIFLDFFENDSISPRKTGIFSIIFGYLLCFPFVDYIYRTVDVVLTIELFASDPDFLASLFLLNISRVIYLFALVFFSLVIPFVYIRTLGRMLTNFPSPERRRQIRFMQVGTILIFWGLLVPSFLEIMGILIFAYGYLRPLGAPFLHPRRIDRLLVLNENGLPLFSLTFGTAPAIDEILLSGFLSAITSMIRGTADSQAIIHSIKLGDLELLMAREYSILSVLIVEKSSRYLTLSLSAFAKQFYTTFKEEIDTDAIIEKSHYYGKAKLLAKEYFGLGI
ncbi:MAG: hypothetical protein ACFFC7_14465 [Candidatus Hermodarchaeota archaeon]